jgi:hypothetical protein
MKWQLSDWLIMVNITSALTAATVYLFMHSGDAAFLTWCGLVTTVTTAYHWLIIRDSKEKDASC